MARGLIGVAAAAALTFAAGLGHAETRPPYGGRIVASLPSGPSSFDPLAAVDAADIVLTGLLFDPLYRLDAAGRPVPALALDLPLFVDGAWTIPLRDGVHFHDGRPLRPADVEASLKRARDGRAAAWALAGIGAISVREGNLVLDVRRDVTPRELATRLAAPQLAVTPLGRAPGTHPVGSGPFKLKKVDGRRLELEAFADAWSGRPYLDALVLRWFEDPDEEARAYEAGEADLSLRGAVAFAGHEPKYPTTVQEGPAVALQFIGFGAAHPGDKEPKFRRGVSLAIGRAALRHVGSGEQVVPSSSPLAPDRGGPTPTVADLAPHETEAAPLLAATPPLELIVDKTRADDLEVAARVVAALDRVGVTVTFTPLAPADLARRVAAGQCDLWLGQLVAPAPEPLAAFAAAFAAGGDDALAARIGDGSLTVEAAGAAFAARLPIVPLAHRALRAHHKKGLRGLVFDALGLPAWADVYLWTGPDEP